MAIFYTDSASFNDISVTGSLIVSGGLTLTSNQPFNITGSLFQLTRKAIQLRLTRIFKKGLNCSVSVNILRHSYISFGKESGEFLGEEEEYAKKMGHSVMTQLDYYKSSKKIATQKK